MAKISLKFHLSRQQSKIRGSNYTHLKELRKLTKKVKNVKTPYFEILLQIASKKPKKAQISDLHFDHDVVT